MDFSQLGSERDSWTTRARKYGVMDVERDDLVENICVLIEDL